MIETLYSDKIDETLFYKKSACGLDMYIAKKVGFSKTFGYVAVKYGSNDNHFMAKDKVYRMPEGIAHFLEHKLFENNDEPVFDQFAKRSASVNAYTNFTSTVYYFSSTDQFADNMKGLLSFVQHLTLTDESVEKEKGIISQEIKMYEDNVDWRLYFGTLKNLYHKQPVRNDIAGSVESVMRINKDQLEACYDAFYTPQNMFTLVVGDVDVHETFDLIESQLTTDFKNRPFQVSRFSVSEPPHVLREHMDLVSPIATPKFYIGYKDTAMMTSDKQRYRQSIVTKLMLELLFGKGGHLYEKLYEAKLINPTFGFDYMYEQHYAYAIAGGDGKDPLKVTQVINDYLKTPDGLWSHEDFDRVKKKAMGRYLFSYNNLDAIGSQYVTSILKGVNPLTYLEVLASIQVEEVAKRCEGFIKNGSQTLMVLSSQSGQKGGQDA